MSNFNVEGSNGTIMHFNRFIGWQKSLRKIIQSVIIKQDSFTQR